MNLFSYDPSKYPVYRPQYPNEIFSYLKQVTQNAGVVLECGCGSGQATAEIASHFRRVVALDVSSELITQAEKISNVLYVQSDSSQLPIRGNSIDLICIAQALHWFDLDKFYEEVNRVLHPTGMIAAWCYNKMVIEPQIDKVIDGIYNLISDSSIRTKQKQFVHDNYESLPFPFPKVETPKFSMKTEWNLFQLIGYINTWPSVIDYQNKFNVNAVEAVEKDLVVAWGDPIKIKTIHWDISLLVGWPGYSGA